ncbi:hypothetical protein EYC80_007026 [Monilinia laxa]|uniref:Uncharacterized protein n=1 Tax=Monilinia laxa TaxID=61186 RepID=A0A5N6JZY9_MONLA|nr:hypothetical protein EYC80_007026 [Monilinia laxa]
MTTMATNRELLQEACDWMRLGKALTSKMKTLLARVALEHSGEMEGSIRASASRASHEAKAGEAVTEVE